MVKEHMENNKKKLFQGYVVSDKMEKTIVVEHHRTYMHPHVRKVMRSVKKYKVHDEQEQAQVGDMVEFYEGRPISKTKYMYLSRIVSRSMTNAGNENDSKANLS